MKLVRLDVLWVGFFFKYHIIQKEINKLEFYRLSPNVLVIFISSQGRYIVEYSRIINEIANKDSSFPITAIYSGDNTDVFSVNLPERLIVKICTCEKHEIRLQSQLMDAIDYGDGLTARILHWETREIDDVLRVVQIMPSLD